METCEIRQKLLEGFLYPKNHKNFIRVSHLFLEGPPGKWAGPESPEESGGTEIPGLCHLVPTLLLTSPLLSVLPRAPLVQPGPSEAPHLGERVEGLLPEATSVIKDEKQLINFCVRNCAVTSASGL